jgi:hypothetical protein
MELHPPVGPFQAHQLQPGEELHLLVRAVAVEAFHHSYFSECSVEEGLATQMETEVEAVAAVQGILQVRVPLVAVASENLEGQFAEERRIEVQ